MSVRPTMTQLLARVRLLIADPAGASQQFGDQDIQDTLDDGRRDDIRYEDLQIAPSIVNTASTNNQASTIFADFYSKYQWWEPDLVLQAYTNGQAWLVVTPVASDYITGHFQFETNVFTTGTVPGQVPPVFATGKVYDLNGAAADLLRYWAATLASAYDFTSDGATFRRSQLMAAKLTLAEHFARRAKPRKARLVRNDLAGTLSSKETPLLDSGVGGGSA